MTQSCIQWSLWCLCVCVCDEDCWSWMRFQYMLQKPPTLTCSISSTTITKTSNSRNKFQVDTHTCSLKTSHFFQKFPGGPFSLLPFEIPCGDSAYSQLGSGPGGKASTFKVAMASRRWLHPNAPKNTGRFRSVHGFFVGKNCENHVCFIYYYTYLILNRIFWLPNGIFLFFSTCLVKIPGKYEGTGFDEFPCGTRPIFRGEALVSGRKTSLRPKKN